MTEEKQTEETASEARPVRKTQLRGVLMLLLTAIIWGGAFVAQKIGMDAVGPLTFSGIRILMGATALLPVVIFKERRDWKSLSDEERPAHVAKSKKLLRRGIILGFIFALANNVQQIAINESTPGKVAFITALYIFLVPVIGLIFFKKHIRPLTWVCIFFGIVGLYFLSIDPGDLTVTIGDVLPFCCAVAFAVQITTVSIFSADTDGVRLAFLQFATAGILTIILMFIFETPTLPAIRSALIPMLYAGVLSCGIGYTFQILGQKYASASVSALLLCMESVFAVITEAIVLGQMLSGRELLGCGIMFAAIVLSQLAEQLPAKGEDAPGASCKKPPDPQKP